MGVMCFFFSVMYLVIFSWCNRHVLLLGDPKGLKLKGFIHTFKNVPHSQMVRFFCGE